VTQGDGGQSQEMGVQGQQELTGLAGLVADVVTALGEAGVAVLVALENVFPPLPSEVILPLAGFLASRGRMGLLLVIVAATLGSIVGAVVLYEVGARIGRERVRRLVDRFPLLEVRDLDRAERWFQRHGDASVLLGRWLPVVRSLVSVPAGVEGMGRLRFVLLTALGSGVWNTAFVLAGYGLGARFREVGQYSSYLNAAVYVALVVALAVAVRRALHRRRAGACR
jgi:membrane protein DedA with SNARE-associated domain